MTQAALSSAPPQASTARVYSWPMPKWPRIKHRPGVKSYRIICAVAVAAGVPIRVLVSDSRSKKAVHARFVIFDLLSRHKGMSHCAIGRAIGRHYSTVWHGLGRVNANRAAFADLIARAEQLLAEWPK